MLDDVMLLSLAPIAGFVVQMIAIAVTWNHERKLRRQLVEARETIERLEMEHELALSMAVDRDALTATEAERDELLGALYRVADERDPVAAHAIAHDELNLPYFPPLRRSA